MSNPVYVCAQDARSFLTGLADDSVDLLLTDPPYSGIVGAAWDNQWPSAAAYARWLVDIFQAAKPKLRRHGSIVFFGGLGKHGNRPFFETLRLLESETSYLYRNIITWGKRRAYGKSHDYLFCREEIAWYSVSSERTEVRFNIPLLAEKRGYKGFNPDYPAKSEFKRVTNVWSDIPELMRPERECQKPLDLMDRLVQTHSNPGDLVVDCFAGWGSTGVSALRCGRRFLGCEAIPQDAQAANERCRGVVGHE